MKNARQNYLKQLADALTREQCIQVLTQHGIQCYDHESLRTLQKAVLVNLEDRTLSKEDLP